MKYLKYKVIDVDKMYSRNNMNNASKIAISVYHKKRVARNDYNVVK